MYIQRAIPLFKELQKKSILLLGPRRTGKTQLIKHELKPDFYYNLLEADTFRELSHSPHLIRERAKKNTQLIIIDEIQKLPLLMDEVHNLIESTGIRFLLTGSSARKLKRTHTGLMAGRARIKQLLPFCYSEITKQFNLSKILNYGTLPPVFLSEDPWDELDDYIGTYLKEEILSEALVRKIDNFSRFLEFAALTNAQILNYENLASDAQIPARTIREYYSILTDTLVGYMLHPIRSTKNRKSIATGKFYFFDIGVTNFLTKRRQLAPQTPEFGFALEHFVFLELYAYKIYHNKDMSIEFWNSPRNGEVDFVVNQDIAIEVKATHSVSQNHLKGLELFSKDEKVKRKIIVCLEKIPRQIKDIEIIPIKYFLDMLYGGVIG